MIQYFDASALDALTYSITSKRKQESMKHLTKFLHTNGEEVFTKIKRAKALNIDANFTTEDCFFQVEYNAEHDIVKVVNLCHNTKRLLSPLFNHTFKRFQQRLKESSNNEPT